MPIGYIIKTERVSAVEARYHRAMSIVTLILILYFVALAVLSSLKTTEINWRLAVMLRVFFPSWKFFEDYAEIPKLFFRASETDQWRIIEEPADRTALQLIFNPKGNQSLALGSLVQQLLFDLEKTKKVPDFEKTVSFELVRELVRRRLGPGARSYQFKLATVVNGQQDDILVSARFKT